MSKTDQQLPSQQRFEAVASAYRELEEKHKKQLFRAVGRADSRLMDRIVHSADIGIGGIRIQKAIERAELCREKIDDYLTSEKGNLDLAQLVTTFFEKSRPDLLDDLQEQIDVTSPLIEDIRSFCDKLKAEGEPFAGLFYASYLLISPGITKELPSPLTHVPSDLNKLERSAHVLENAAEETKIGHPVDIERTHSVLVESQEAALRMRSAIETAAVSTGVEPASWASREELDELVKKLALKLENQNTVGQRTADFLIGLSQLISKMGIKHKSSKRAQEISILRDEAVKELGQKASATGALPLPRSEALPSPKPWLIWSLSLVDDELEGFSRLLVDNGYASLARYIEVSDSSWLPEELPAEASKPREKLDATSIESRPADAGCQGSAAESARQDQPGAISGGDKTEAPKPSEGEKPQPPVHHESSLVTSGSESSISAPGLDSDSALRLIEPVDFGTELESLFSRGDVLSPLHHAAVAWTMVSIGHLGLAYHITPAHNSPKLDINLFPLPWSLELAALSQHINYMQTPLIQRAQQLVAEFPVESLFSNDTPIRTMINRMILAGAGIRAAIMAPDSGVDEVLKGLHLGEIPSLRNLVQSVIQFSQRRQIIAPEYLKESLTQEEWASRKADFSRRTASWWERALHATTNFGPATSIWLSWLKPGHVVYDLIRPIVEGSEDPSKAYRILRDLDPDRLIDNTNQKELKRPQAIEGRARKILFRMLDEALSIAREWISLLNRKKEVSPYVRESIQQLIRAFDRTANEATDAVTGMASSTSSFPLQSAAHFAAQNIKTVSAFLNGRIEMDPSMLVASSMPLNRDLLLFDSVHLDENWLPDQAGDALCREILKSLAAQDIDRLKAFDQHCQKGDLLAARRIIDWLESEGAQEKQIDVLRRQLDDTRIRHQVQLRTGIDEARMHLNDGLAKGLIGQTDYSNASDKVESLSLLLFDDDRRAEYDAFFMAYRTLADVRSKLSEERQIQTEKIRQELRSQVFSEDDQKRILSVLDAGDVHLASDFIERLRSGQSLIEATEPRFSHFAKFFGLETSSVSQEGCFNALAGWLTRIPQNEPAIPELIRRQQPLGCLDISDIPAAQCKQHAEAMTAWYTIKRKRRIEDLESFTPIFKALGMNLYKGRLTPAGDRTWLNVLCEQQIVPPVAQYGSQAQGRYKILLNVSLASEDELFSAFEKQPLDKSGEMIFYFGRLDEKQRRNFANLCIRAKRTIVLIDDLVMLYLASAKGRKFEALMACTLPFTYFMPYMGMSTGLLPPEMFFGRANEIRALEIMTPEGSSLVYGGRQIGKTFLLKQVQRRVHDPRHGRAALFIDLKHHGLGLNRHVETLWPLLAGEISKYVEDCFDAEIKPNMSFEDFRGPVVHWLRQVASRRLLLLLDEADIFLEMDGRSQYPICAHLKGLMEATDLRFKAVFAGLHNVQRSTRVVNNPLAHLGRPLCVGPLLGPTEAREAQALIERPLAAAGVFFDTPDLAIRILAQANYYPNLIQIYGQNLVHHALEKRGASGSRETPPFVLTSDDIKDVYERKALGDELRSKFRLTLDLDGRFQLIANLLALYYEDFPEGFTTSWIFSNALDLWPQGFRENSPDIASSRPIPFDMFQSLLEEMVGLGILRKVDADRFNLRSTNVVSLLGTKRQIEKILEGFAEMAPPLTYSPDTFRTLVDENDRTRRSPLTAAQESRLKQPENRVSIIAGVPAAGLLEVKEALLTSLKKEFVAQADGVSEASFHRAMNSLTTRKSSGKTFLIIPPDIPWDLTWIQEALDRLARYSRKDAFAGVLFMAGPQLLWEHARALMPLPTERPLSYDIMTLHPWKDDTVRMWMEDASLAMENAGLRNQVYEATGFWPGLLRELASKTSNKPIDAACLKGFQDSVLAKPTVLDHFFIPEGAWRVAPMSVLDCLAEWGEPATEEDLISLISLKTVDLDAAALRSILWWAQTLDLVRHHEKGWQLDPFLQRVLVTRPS